MIVPLQNPPIHGNGNHACLLGDDHTELDAIPPRPYLDNLSINH